MLKAFLITLNLLVFFSGFSQSYIGKTKEEIQKMAEDKYDEVELIDEADGSFKLLCDKELNEFLFANGVCIKFNSIKSYKCNCLASDLKAYNENLEPMGNMKWISKDGSRLYEINLDKEDYKISITQNGVDIAGIKN